MGQVYVVEGFKVHGDWWKGRVNNLVPYRELSQEGKNFKEVWELKKI